MLLRAVKSMAVAAACWMVVTQTPEIARYLRMREMSRPEPASPPPA